MFTGVQVFSHLSGTTVVQLPICGKILERLMFSVMFKFFIENDLVTSKQFTLA